MAYLNGHSTGTVLGLQGGSMGGVTPPPTALNLDVIDGTPVRVVILALSAAVGLTALRLAGFKFNVGVSG